MTLLEALQDIGKGRIIDNGCDYQLIALAKGVYTITIENGRKIEITLDGKQGENARRIEGEFNRITGEIEKSLYGCKNGALRHISDIEYKKR